MILRFRLITKRDMALSLLMSIGSFGVSIGIIGIKNQFISISFFIIPLVMMLVLFSIFKSKTSSSFDNKKRGY